MNSPRDDQVLMSGAPMRSFLRSKIHRATVTQAELHYEGSLTLDRLLMVEADILPGEEVHVWNVTQGTRFSTYAIEGPPDTGVLCVNGAAAHLAKPGDIIIVATFHWIPESAIAGYCPRVVFVDSTNRVTERRPEVVGPSC
jgi:aspartate 1-decarboxylase